MNRNVVAALAGIGFAATVVLSVEAQPLPQPLIPGPQAFGVRTMSFDLWCQQMQRLPQERCRERRAEDLKAFNDYREVVERYELQYLKQVEKDRSTTDFLTRDPNSTVLDKSIGIR